MDNLLIITGLVFICSFLVVLGLFMLIRSSVERQALLEKIQHDGGSAVSLRTGGTDSKSGLNVGPLVRLSMWFGSLIKPKDEDELGPKRLLFLRAGYRHHDIPIVFLGLKLLLTLALPAAFILCQAFYLRLPSAHAIIIAITLGIVGHNLPHMWLKMKISSRKEKIQEGFPDALDLLVVCVEAGMGLDSAINRVAVEMESTNKPISEEFKMLNMELRAGRTRRDALKNLSARTDLDDVTSLVTLINQTDKFGTSVGPALRIHSDSMRTKRYQRAEERAAKIPTKLVFPLLLFIFPSMFIVFLAPPIIQLVRMWKGGM